MPTPRLETAKVSVSTSNPDFCTVEVTCPRCHKPLSIHDVPIAALEELAAPRERGRFIQNILPDHTPSQREALQTGFCDECWDIVCKF